jgi:hypothetical protein
MWHPPRQEEIPSLIIRYNAKMDYVDMAGSLGGVCSSVGNSNRLVDQPGEPQRQRAELASLRRVRIDT